MRNQLRSHVLSPHSQIELSPFSSVSYVSGQVPYLLLVVNGETHVLRMGDCLPVAEGQAFLGNPFSRTARVSVGYNWPVSQSGENLLSSINNQSGFVTYFANALIKDEGADLGRDKGFAIWQQKGAARYQIVLGQNCWFYGLRGVQPEFLDHRPAAFYSNVTDFSQTSGDVYDSALFRSGSYTEAEASTWYADANYPLENRVTLTYDKSADLVLEQGSVLFVMKESTSGNVDAELRVTDFGTVPGYLYG